MAAPLCRHGVPRSPRTPAALSAPHTAWRARGVVGGIRSAVLNRGRRFVNPRRAESCKSRTAASPGSAPHRPTAPQPHSAAAPEPGGRPLPSGLGFFGCSYSLRAAARCLLAAAHEKRLHFRTRAGERCDSIPPTQRSGGSAEQSGAAAVTLRRRGIQCVLQRGRRTPGDALHPLPLRGLGLRGAGGNGALRPTAAALRVSAADFPPPPPQRTPLLLKLCYSLNRWKEAARAARWAPRCALPVCFKGECGDGWRDPTARRAASPSHRAGAEVGGGGRQRRCRPVRRPPTPLPIPTAHGCAPPPQIPAHSDTGGWVRPPLFPPRSVGAQAGGAAPPGKLFVPAVPPPTPGPTHARSAAASHRPAWALRAARALGCVGSRPGRCGDSPRRWGVGKRGKSSAGVAGRGNPIGPYGTGNPRGRSRRRRGRTGTRRCPRNRPNGAPRRDRRDAAPAAPVRSERRTTRPDRETGPGRSGPAAAPHRRRRAGGPGGRRPSERGAGPARTGSAARRCSLLTPGALLGNGRRRPHLTHPPLPPPRTLRSPARPRFPRGLPSEGRGRGGGKRAAPRDPRRGCGLSLHGPRRPVPAGALCPVGALRPGLPCWQPQMHNHKHGCHNPAQIPQPQAQDPKP